MDGKQMEVVNSLKLAIPLIPVFVGFYLFIGVLSPLAWVNGTLNLYFLLCCILLGLLSTYCTTRFVLKTMASSIEYLLSSKRDLD
jgi:hypothetical protein